MRVRKPGVAAAFAVSMVFATVTIARLASASHGGMDLMAIDMDPTGNTISSVGSIQQCREADAGEVFDIDVVAKGIPESNPMFGFSFDLGFPGSQLTVTGNNFSFKIGEEPGSQPTSASDFPPDSSGSFTSGAIDIGEGSPYETGDGTLSRLTLTVSGAPAPGVYALTLSDNIHIDPMAVSRFPHVTQEATIAIETSCSGTPPTPTPTGQTPTPTPFGQTPAPTPTPTPTGQTPTPTPFGQTPTPTPTPTPTGQTPTPTPFGQTPAPTPTPTPLPLRGDMDCDGDVDAVDALIMLRFLAGLPLGLPDGCPSPAEHGDMDCDGDMDAVDALAVLRFLAGLPLSLPDGCPPPGQQA